MDSAAALVSLTGLGLLVHESVYFASRGTSHVTDDLAPVLGVHAGSRTRAALHLVFIVSALVAFIQPSRAAAAGLGLTLAALIATFPTRTPNHLVVALFLIGPSALGIPSPDAVQGGRGITAMTYLLAAFHKINRSYFEKTTSCAYGLVLHYLLQRDLVPVSRRLNASVVIWAVLLAELALPGLLLVPAFRSLGLAIGISLALAFGFIGHPHFSIVMLAGLSTFVTGPLMLVPPDTTALAAAALSALLLSALLGNTAAYRYPRLAALNYFALAYVACTVAATAFGPGGAANSAWEPPQTLLALFLLYAANGLAPYLGFKFDGSLAMFSGLRPDLWDHLVIGRPRRWLEPRYLTDLTLTAGENIGPLQRIASDLLPRAAHDAYTVGYVAAVCRELERRGHPQPVTAAGLLTRDNREMRIGGERGERLRWFERLSLYPYRLPGLGEPLCM